MREVIIGLAAVALTLLSGAPLAQDVTGWGAELEKRPARPFIIVAPRFPKEAAAQKRSATVDVVGRISAEGLMEGPAFRSSSEDSAFEREVSEVIGLWVFKAPVETESCKPKSGEAQVRVWFEIGDGGPKVSISAPSEDARIARDGIYPEGTPAITYKIVPRFPRSAIERGIQGGRVLALARVNRSGDVDDVLIQETRADRALVRETERALKLWKFDVSRMSFEGRSHLCAEIPVDYRLLN